MSHVIWRAQRRLCWALALVLFLGGCSGWRVAKPSADVDKPENVQVTLKNTDVFELKSAYAQNDTLFGFADRFSGANRWDIYKRIPLEEIDEIKTKHKTNWLMVGVIFAGVVIGSVFLGIGTLF